MPTPTAPLPQRAALAVLLALAAIPAMAAEPRSRTGRFRLPGACARVMPLLTARGERQWAEGWRPELLSGDDGRGSVFRTRHADGRATVWIVVDYYPAAGRASYARLAEGSDMGLVDVRCRPAPGGSTVQVSYTLTGLNTQGAAFVDAFLAEAHYAAMMREWRDAMAAALQRRPR